MVQSTTGNAIAKMYGGTGQFNSTNGTWKRLIPLSSTGPSSSRIGLWIFPFKIVKGIFGWFERIRLDWVTQKLLRADTYRGLADAVEAGDHDRGRIGLKVILPSTFTGSPRYMQ